MTTPLFSTSSTNDQPTIGAGYSGELKYLLKQFLLLFCLLTFLNFTASGQAGLLKDLNQNNANNSNRDHELTNGGESIYYVDRNVLWISEGTTETTTRLKSFSSIWNLFMVGSTLYFSASDGAAGVELWKSDGSADGTQLVKDLSPGTADSYPEGFATLDGKLYFTAMTAGFGRELWSTDGTPGGTVMVKDILKGLGSSNPGNLTRSNASLFFSANDGSTGYELWKTDGTASGTVRVADIRPETKSSSSPKFLTDVNGMLYFSATTAAMGTELWKSDGTSQGTVLVKDIRPGTTGSGVENIINVSGNVFFTAHDGIHGDELWKSNGTATGTVIVKDLNPGGAGSNSTHPHGVPMRGFTNIGGILFFVASKGYTYYIYRSDGTEAGTFMLQQANGLGLNPPQPEFTLYNGEVIFFNSPYPYSGESGLVLWKMPVHGNTAEVVRRFSGLDDFYDSYKQELITFNGNLYTFGRLYRAEIGASFQFIRSDGTSEGTVVIKEVEPGETLGSNPADMVRVNDKVYIRTVSDYPDYLTKGHLYRTDGTAAGTIKIMDMPDGNEMIQSGNRLIFGSVDETGQAGLYASEGTPETTVKLGSLYWNSTRPEMITDVNGTIYFANQHTYDGRTYYIFWKSDGTSTGTRAQVYGFAKIHSITRVVGKVMLLVGNPEGDLQVWKTINVGTNLIAEIPSRGQTKSKHNPVAVQDLVMYFVANDGVHGNEIWRTDGYSSSSTYMLFDHNTNDPTDEDGLEDDIRSLTTMKKVLYFSAKANDGTWGWYSSPGNSTYTKIVDMPPVAKSVVINGLMYLFTQEHIFAPHQLWVSNGTTAGTKFLADIPGYWPVDHTVINNILYFNTPQGDQVWRSNGTACGTYPINTGVQYAWPVEALGTDLIFGGYKYETGMEPYVYRNIPAAPAPPCSASVAMEMAEASHELRQDITPYPNPFMNDFTLRVNGNEDAKIEMTVMNSYGEQILRLKDLKPNTDYEHIGADWTRGFYILKVYKDGEVTNYNVVKK